MDLKLTISEMQVLARKRGGRCLSTAYNNLRTKIRWRCAKGHEWEATPGNVKHRGTWCPKCLKGVGTIEEMQALSKKHRGECLSTIYVNLGTKLHWRCAKGHEWEATPGNVKHGGTWCPKCSGKVLGTIEEMQALAKRNGGKCLSTTYINAHKKLRWRCAKGHEWEARPSSIKAMGTWCPKCSGKMSLGTIEEMQALAKKHRGECLSLTYVGALKKLRWRCAKGHEWKSTPTNVKNGGHWCRECRKVRKRMKAKDGRRNVTTAKQKK